jgi:hypothetical protein
LKSAHPCIYITLRFFEYNKVAGYGAFFLMGVYEAPGGDSDLFKPQLRGEGFDLLIGSLSEP